MTVSVLTSDSGGGSGGATSSPMSSDLGRVLIGLVGLGVVAVGGYHVVRARTRV